MARTPPGETSAGDSAQVPLCGPSAPFSFEVAAVNGQARAGLVLTPHGPVPTPVFMPVGTQASVKSLSPHDAMELGASIILANAYHLALEPGSSLVASCGGLHRFMSWPRPILTDSGGFQIFSLGELRRVTPDGVAFRSHHDHSERFITPEQAIAIQEDLGADIIMAFDECAAHSAGREYHVEALDRTHRWAERCLRAKKRADQALFGIVQGGVFPDLRRASASILSSLDLPGYAIGGLSVGEPKELMWPMVSAAAECLPADKPRYLMGVGTPEDLIEAVARGVDMLDSVMPTRVARNGALFTRSGRINIRNAAFRDADRPIEPDCDCYTCSTFGLAYLHHLFRAGELLAYRLATVHNLRFMVRLAEEMRKAILEGEFEARFGPKRARISGAGLSES